MVIHPAHTLSETPERLNLFPFFRKTGGRALWHSRIFFWITVFAEMTLPAIIILENPDQYLTPIGGFLRKTSLDELSQLWSILKGEISLVGPRPALFNQDDLIGLRTKKGVHQLTPGLTGWAQINGRDDLPIPIKVEFDEYYLRHRSFLFDLKILFMTFLKVIKSEGVKH